MAKGPIAGDVPHGAWTLYHPSGNVAARGSFHRGRRHGAWQFFHDTPREVPIARGRFVRGSVVGTWRHFDARGRLLAVTRPAPGRTPWDDASVMTVVPGPSGVRHLVHRFGGVDSQQLHGFFKGRERLYVQDRQEAIYDGDGHRLTRVGEVWHAAPCGWSTKRKRIAGAGDIATLHWMLSSPDSDPPRCGEPRPVSAARNRAIDATLAAREAIRMPTPEFVTRLSLGEATLGENETNDEAADTTQPEWQDMARLLAASMTWYIEWPHIDGRFLRLFRTVPGYRFIDSGMPEEDLAIKNERGE
jgi:hypothetical protein